MDLERLCDSLEWLNGKKGRFVGRICTARFDINYHLPAAQSFAGLFGWPSYLQSGEKNRHKYLFWKDKERNYNKVELNLFFPSLTIPDLLISRYLNISNSCHMKIKSDYSSANHFFTVDIWPICVRQFWCERLSMSCFK